MIEREELEGIADLAVRHNLWIVSDEIYKGITYGAIHTPIASLGEEIFNRAVTIGGLSKSHAMTGWRIGYAGGPQDVIDAMISFQSQTTSNITSIAQKAALEALTGNQDEVVAMKREFEKRRGIVLALLSEIPGLSFHAPEGAFYVFSDIRGLLGAEYRSSLAWCERLLEEQGVALVPGEAFLAPGYFRLSFAASEDDLRAGMVRIRQFVNTS